MLIILPSTPTTEKASEWLNEHHYDHQVIPVPESINYKTGSDIALYVNSPQADLILTELTKARFVVMRVFRQFILE